MIQDKGVTIDGGEFCSIPMSPNPSNTMETLKEGFEGPEKNLQVVFCRNDVDDVICSAGCCPSLRREVQRERWDSMLELARCKVLSVAHGAACDAYVLSESSLFVYDARVILKTCGTTRLLHALDDIISIGASIGLGLRAVFYSRKNFTFSHLQPAPHLSWPQEVEFLEDRFSGSSQVIGPTDGDHWCFYLASFDDQQSLLLSDFEQNQDADALPISFFEVKMHEIHPESAAWFVERAGVSGKDVTQQSGIINLLPGQLIDEHQFSPCGYSMNGLLGDCYSTIHITPEPHCSYVSFETNLPVEASPAIRDQLIARVLQIFRPASYTVTFVRPTTTTTAAVPSSVLHLAVPEGFSQCFAPVSCVLNGSLALETWSFVVTDTHAHPLGTQSTKRLLALATTTTISGSPSLLSSPAPSACLLVPSVAQPEPCSCQHKQEQFALPL